MKYFIFVNVVEIHIDQKAEWNTNATKIFIVKAREIFHSTTVPLNSLITNFSLTAKTSTNNKNLWGILFTLLNKKKINKYLNKVEKNMHTIN